MNSSLKFRDGQSILKYSAQDANQHLYLNNSSQMQLEFHSKPFLGPFDALNLMVPPIVRISIRSLTVIKNVPNFVILISMHTDALHCHQKFLPEYS